MQDFQLQLASEPSYVLATPLLAELFQKFTASVRKGWVCLTSLGRGRPVSLEHTSLQTTTVTPIWCLSNSIADASFCCELMEDAPLCGYKSGSSSGKGHFEPGEVELMERSPDGTMFLLPSTSGEADSGSFGHRACNCAASLQGCPN